MACWIELENQDRLPRHMIVAVLGKLPGRYRVKGRAVSEENARKYKEGEVYFPYADGERIETNISMSKIKDFEGLADISEKELGL